MIIFIGFILLVYGKHLRRSSFELKVLVLRLDIPLHLELHNVCKANSKKSIPHKCKKISTKNLQVFSWMKKTKITCVLDHVFNS